MAFTVLPYHGFGAAVLAVVFGMPGALAPAAPPGAGPRGAALPGAGATDRGVLDQWISHLGSRDYRLRVRATRQLQEAPGGTVVACLVESATWSDAEVAARGLRILRYHAEGDDEAVRKIAQTALERLSRSPDARLAARARRLLTESRRRLLRLVEGAGGTVEFADVKRELVAGVHLQRCPHAGDLLGRLKGVETLQRLNLASCDISDPALAALPDITGLKYLCLQSNPVTDTGLEHVARLEGLEALYLSNTKITEAGIEHLRRLVRLEVLWINYTEVGDEAIDALAGLKHLRHLRLTGTRVTEAGLERLAAALPETRITR